MRFGNFINFDAIAHLGVFIRMCLPNRTNRDNRINRPADQWSKYCTSRFLVFCMEINFRYSNTSRLHEKQMRRLIGNVVICRDCAWDGLLMTLSSLSNRTTYHRYLNYRSNELNVMKHYFQSRIRSILSRVIIRLVSCLCRARRLSYLTCTFMLSTPSESIER